MLREGVVYLIRYTLAILDADTMYIATAHDALTTPSLELDLCFLFIDCT
jgi:hypothetical protein